jgi:hypothetical protein
VYGLDEPVDVPLCLAEGHCIEEVQDMDGTNQQRVRINLKQASGGKVQFDITAEFPDEDQAIEHLGKAIDKTKAMCVEKSLNLADAGAA